MQIRWLSLIVALCGTLVFSFTVHAADAKKPLPPQHEKFFRSRMKVKLDVTADQSISNSVTNSIAKELASFKDVEIVDNNPEWQINVIATEFKAAGGQKNEVIISTVILTVFDSNEFLANQLKPEYKNKAIEVTSRLFWYPDHSLYITSSENLESTLKKIIRTFNTKYLEKERKSRRAFKEVIEERK